MSDVDFSFMRLADYPEAYTKLQARVSSLEERMSDSERLIWMVTNDASFGTSGRYLGVQAGVPLWDDVRFVCVPCRHLYEWHCYEGADWRAAIDNAMEAHPCALDEKKGCTNTRFPPPLAGRRTNE